ncbi:hypothetical protein POM88_042793 [Heracleum sosnowskyi]|uniref:Uncharacterized protein n=1 Tax=Heracleum sosnowskyi TaxID=360622 RepID=A0AAD8MC07_9APIA|nr:hypothetical protein POM88_042793 [Heracleum sosnowskyi]
MLNFEGLLDDKGKYRLKNGCWIISNITARKGSRIKDAIDSELIDLLVNVVENYESLDVKNEAAWAISNVIYGAGPDQIDQGSQEIVSLCLEGLVRLEGIKITCNDQPIDSVEWFKVFKKFLVRPQTAQFQIAEEIDELTKIKKIRLIDTIENSEGDMVLHLTCTFEVDSHIAWRITPKGTDQMEVDMPE